MARHFESVEALSEYQAEREVREALRVAAMTPAERYSWLKENWGRLQDSGSLLFAGSMPRQAAARCYASLEEKNRFDEQREIERALQLHSAK
jgi:hypothetical protein